jgi:hypothetical protein
MNKIDVTKSVPTEEWGKFFDQFSLSNRGRHIEIEIIDAELGDEVLIKNAPLLVMIYDRPGKGDNLAIETGEKEMNYGHSIDSPTEVMTGADANGEIVAISIGEKSGRKTLVKLEAS